MLIFIFIFFFENLFSNNTRKLMEIKGIYNDIINEDEYCLIMKMVNCNFINNLGMFKSIYSNSIFENYNFFNFYK